MKTTTAIKDKTIRFTVSANPILPKGHQPHRGGAGAHKHKADKRQGNRSQQVKRIVNEY